MNVQELRERLNQRAVEAKQLVDLSERSDEQEARIDELITEINDLGQRIEREETRAAALKNVDDANKPGASLARTPQTAPDQREARDLRSIGKRFVESDAYKRWVNHPHGKSESVRFNGFRPEVTRDEAIENLDIRTLVTSGTASGSMLLPDAIPTIFRPRERALVMRDVLLGFRTKSDSVTIFQESSFTNAAAEVAEAATVNGSGVSGGVKPESALAFTEVTYPVRTIAHWIPITRQMLEDLPMMESYINDRLMTGLARREDAQIINGDGNAPNLAGLLNTSGIQVLDASYFTNNPVQDAGASNENVNRLLRAKTKIATTGGAQASFYVINPEDMEKILTYTDENRNYLFGGPGSVSVPTLWGLPVVQSEQITTGTALAGDGTMAAVADRSDAQIYVTDSHSDWFIRNIMAVLAEERLALPVFRPIAFARVTLV